jgi:CheY-like chemotaxis protein
MATVLIVEDNRDIAGLYERVFAGHQTRVVADVPEAMSYLRQSCPDLLILDFHLPSGSGLEVLKYLRSSFPTVSVLGISADDLLKEKARQEGIDAFLSKPFRVIDLARTAHTLLSQPRKGPSPSMLAALQEYAQAFQRVYKCPPHGQWTGSQVLINGEVRDEAWFRAETRRLNNLSMAHPPRNYLHRLIDKIRNL